MSFTSTCLSACGSLSINDGSWLVVESGQQLGSGTGTSGDSSSKTVQDASHQAMAVLGIALIAGGEEIGAQMSMRSFSHLVSRQTTICLV